MIDVLFFLFTLRLKYSIPRGSHRGSDLSDLSDVDIEELMKMHKLCRQVSIESPGPAMKDCVFSFVVPVPDTPDLGARVKVRPSILMLICQRLRFDRQNFHIQNGM